MDANNWRPAAPEGEATVEQVDWRTQLQPDTRPRIVNKIMETLKRQLPFSGPECLQELRKIALRFEEMIYAAAASQPDYLIKISLKMLTMENKSQNSIQNTGPMNSASNSNKLLDTGASHILPSQFINVKHIAMSQRASYPHQQMKSGTTFPMSSPQLLQAASPQLPQHSSPQVDQQNILSSLTKTGTPLQSANSSFIVPSPSTPFAPSPMPGDSEKPLSSSLSNVSHQQTLAAPPSLAIGALGMSASPLLAEVTGADGAYGGALSTISGKPNIAEQPLECLLKVVKSLSSKALSASVSDIGSVISMIDRIAGSAPGNGSRAAVGDDQMSPSGKKLCHQDVLAGTRKMKRCTSAMPKNVVSSAGSISGSFKPFTGSEALDLESPAASGVKRPRMEANHVLMEEIREINQRLIDTFVDICDEDTNPITATAEGGEGTVVRCSFSSVALSPDLKLQYASAQLSPIQPLRLVVPANYPNSSPILLDKVPVVIRKEYEDLSAKVNSRFSIHLRGLSQPMLLSEIARTWDICTRAVICEHAQESGGGTFSSKYGTWENCLTAA